MVQAKVLPDVGGELILSEDDREIAIHWCSFLLQGAVPGGSGSTPALRRYWWAQMKLLIEGRSSDQIKRMEIAKGLRSA